MLGDPVLSLTLRAALSLLLASAALHKGRNLGAFRGALSAYALLPRGSVASVAAALAVFESVLAVMLLLPQTASPAAFAAAGLFALYGGAIAINLRRGRSHIECGCAGPLRRQPISSALVWRNLTLCVVALGGAVPVATREVTSIDALTLLAGIAVLALLYLSLDELIARAAEWRAFEAMRA